MCARSSPLSGCPLICYVTDRRGFAQQKNPGSLDALHETISQAISAGADWVQIREKDLSARELARLVRECVRFARSHDANSRVTRILVPARVLAPTRILVNDRLDVALTEGADGVHLGENSVPVAGTKNLIESYRRTQSLENFVVGVSCHSRESAETAARAGADYVFFGPVFATPSKSEFGAPQGLQRLADVCRASRVPVIAIGGITSENAASCIAAGAAGIAAIRLFQDAPHIDERVRSLRETLSRSH